MRVGKQRFTVMFIPHSEKKIFNFQVTVFSLIFICVLLAAIIVGFFGLSTNFTGVQKLLSEKSNNLKNVDASLEVLREEVGQLQQIARTFESTLNNTLSILGVDNMRNASSGVSKGDLTSFFSVEELNDGTLRELSELQSLRAYLMNVVDPLNEISNVLLAQKELLVDIPTLWPVKGVKPNITAGFGPAVHPFTGQWYLHKGIDIAYGYGIPILSTANGKVIQIEYEPLGFGHYVVIRHKYGFYTRYAHLQKVLVKKGQQVERGAIIGTMGSSGLSTGPHLHYEVRIGSQVVDPLKYLSISSALLSVAAKKQ